MSSERDRARELAERIARRLGDAPAHGSGDDATSLRSTLAEIQRRLAHIESHIRHDEGCEQETARARGATSDSRASGTTRQSQEPVQARPTLLSGTYVPAVSHPSQERFHDVGEAVAEFVEFVSGEKTCNVEPGGKPCDHCGMCSSRGF